MASKRRSSKRNFSQPLPSIAKRGRRRLETAETLRDVWVFVETSRRLTGLSVLQVCRNSSFTFVCIWSGRSFSGSRGAVVRPPSGLSYSRVLTGETLRRVYYDANGLLQGEIAAHAEALAFFADRGVKVSSFTQKCEVEVFWRSLVDAELTSLQNDARRISPQLGQPMM